MGLALALLLALLVVGAHEARAGEAAFRHSRVELVDAGWLEHEGARYRLAAVVIHLQPGWKTYWRLPGDGGVPPRFDFSGSENVKVEDVRVLLPAPSRFTDPLAGDVIGYKDLAVFPLLVSPADPARPVRLNLRLDYGVCGEICTSATATATLALPPDAHPDETTRNLALEWVKKTPLFDDGELRVTQARLKDGEPLTLLLTLAGPQAERVRDILAEGMELAAFGKPEKVASTDDAVTYALPIRGLADRKDFHGVKLRLTILLGERAIERTITLP